MPRQRVKKYANRPQISRDGDDDGSDESSESSESSEYSTEEDIHSDASQSDEDGDDNEYSEIFEDYSCPDHDPFQNPTDPDSASAYDQFSWILLWIMKFRSKFNIPNTATEALLKFMKLVLLETGHDNARNFPNSLYLAKNTLGINDGFQSFVSCTRCHKLYKKQEVDGFRQNGQLAVMKCRHVEYPNSSVRRIKLCQTPLSRQTRLLNNNIVNHPVLIYPFTGIIQQLANLYRQPGFETSLQHWANRSTFSDLLTDIYDGQIWQSLKESNEENASKFFRPEVADSHLGLMLNLDWF